MKIIFFGTPQSAVPSFFKILENGHRIELVITQPDKPTGRGKTFTPPPLKEAAQKFGIPVYQPLKIREDSFAFEKIKEINPDLIVVVAYGQIIPASIIYHPKYGSVNVHFSLLPKYRGAAPVQWTILNGEKTTGVSIFRLNEKMDEGDILSQKEVEILPNEKGSHLEARLAEIGAELLVDTISKLKEGKIKPKKQNHSLASYAPKLKKEDGLINWSQTSQEIDRLVRAMDPWPSAYSFIQGKRIKITDGKVFESPSSLADSYSFGKIWKITPEGIFVTCGKSTVYLIEQVQPEGKKKMSAYSFTLGARLKPGEKFDSSLE
ncbi:MAG: methionyl-tRNA formyltransferase [Candidatus Aminicenantia bacterium]